MKTSRNETYETRSTNHRAQRAIRLAFVAGATGILLILRAVDPVNFKTLAPFPTSCGAITGLPCIFCGMTRALHSLLNGDFGRALYFNWLAFPFLALIAFLIVLFAIEIAKRRSIVNRTAVTPITIRKLTIIGLVICFLWALQVYLAVSQDKHELLNPRGPLYTLFVR
jgi:Protein of unknown function (DUF2752)